MERQAGRPATNLTRGQVTATTGYQLRCAAPAGGDAHSGVDLFGASASYHDRHGAKFVALHRFRAVRISIALVYQMVLKGIPNLDVAAATHVLNHGILCNWWLDAKTISPAEIKSRLNEKELSQHLRQYGQTNAKKGGRKNGEVSPFISTTAGTRQAGATAYWEWPAFFTALRFATGQFQTDGCIFHAWVECATRPSVPVSWLAEEIRDVHQWGSYFRYHHQGELTAKIEIPSICLQKVEIFTIAEVDLALSNNLLPKPSNVVHNADYVDPLDLLPLRNFV